MCETFGVQENPTITAAEIARLAGVGRAAVSNWRKRHPDFPAPVGGTTASPEFDLIQVEQWLRAQGKLPELATADRSGDTSRRPATPRPPASPPSGPSYSHVNADPDPATPTPNSRP